MNPAHALQAFSYAIGAGFVLWAVLLGLQKRWNQRDDE